MTTEKKVETYAWGLGKRLLKGETFGDVVVKCIFKKMMNRGDFKDRILHEPK